MQERRLGALPAKVGRSDCNTDGLARTHQRPVPVGLGAAQQHAATTGQAAADALSSRARPKACIAAAIDATELRPATNGSGACSAWRQDTNARGTEARCGGRLVSNCGCALQRCIVNTAWQPPVRPTHRARQEPSRSPRLPSEAERSALAAWLPTRRRRRRSGTCPPVAHLARAARGCPSTSPPRAAPRQELQRAALPVQEEERHEEQPRQVLHRTHLRGLGRPARQPSGAGGGWRGGRG